MTRHTARTAGPPEPLGPGHPFRQWKTWRVPGTDLTLTGYSRANDKTFFHIPELRCSLDAGLCEGRQVDTVLLTHAHHDHAKDLDFLAGNPSGVDVYLPAEAVPYADAYIRASGELNHGPGFDPAFARHRLHGVRQGDEFVFGRRRHHVRVVECEHKVPCVGYALSEMRKSLRPEFEELRRSLVEQGRGGEFGRLMARKRAEGVEVEVEARRPIFAYLGDTHVRVFERNPWLFDYPVVVTECTFLHDTEAERAERVGHTVWSGLKPVVEARPETLFVLIHFSLRHTDREVLDFFEREWERAGDARPDNVVLWAHRESHLPERAQPSVLWAT
ncbi:MBL fold metallo-hydrolase [Sinosporangium siamense]|uniref:Metallo-beta-lactamase domain-containing protein n=1 Tax=Sinosporangium siamense TaxID=1367973 RepID=A0A919RC45_9ACTN|nr:MBL fold metallo-hydrolase [Sinosporangium siamense]GII90717.1 hypothetical protein Ssi02_09480 [Sinosporangium siamense]